MATQKRRVIYVSDEEWAAWQKAASANGRTVSSWIRGHVIGPITPSAEFRPPRTAGEQRDELRGFNTRPFTPVPKHK